MTECPRWRLRTAHHLRVPELPDGTVVEWEHKEINRANGRQARKLYKVPMLLEPEEPSLMHPHEGAVVVAHAVPGLRNDIHDVVFIGDPTPDMEPLNVEAEALSAACKERWDHPIDSLPGVGAMSDGERAFMENMMRMMGQQQAVAASVPKSEFDALKAELEQIKALLTKPPEGATSAVARRA